MTNATTLVLIVAGEASGDLYGGLLMRAMAASIPPGTPPPEFVGAGGPTMRAAGLRPLADAAALGVTGFLEVLGSLPQIWQAFRRSCRVLEDGRRRPDLVVLIDYPDFNLRLARRARRAGVPVLYFVAPQVWAWRRGRLRHIAKDVDRMLLILPFEEDLHRAYGVRADFVGHPLLDLARASLNRSQALASIGLDHRRPTVGLLPGSRRNEISRHLPPMIGAARILRQEFADLQFLLPVSPTLPASDLDAMLRRCGPLPGLALVRSDRYDAIAACAAAAVASGTATLETALLGVPLTIVYRMRPATWALARLLSRTPHVGMPNLIVGARIAPELLQGACTAPRIAAEIRRLLVEPDAAAAMRRDLGRVRERLGKTGAIGRVAAAAWDMIATHRAVLVA